MCQICPSPKRIVARGLCQSCYEKHARAGTLAQFSKRSPTDRFLAHFTRGEATECWEWRGWLREDGYGGWTDASDTQHRAHRVMWSITIGDIPDGMSVLHRCDNRRCVNPAHLFLGTLHDNMRDMVSKGRQARGERHGHATLTQPEVEAIRAHPGTQMSIAQKFGVHQSAVSRIKNGKRWSF